MEKILETFQALIDDPNTSEATKEIIIQLLKGEKERQEQLSIQIEQIIKGL
jgi:hypothetical protein